MFKKLFYLLLGFLLVFTPFKPAQTEAATLFPLDSTITGSLEKTETDDVYQIQLDKPGRITLTAKSYLYGMNVRVLDQEGMTEFYSKNIWYGTEAEPKQAENSLDLEAGVYFIKIKKLDDYTGNYQLKVSFQSANNQDVEANNTPSTAQPLTLNAKPIKGFLSEQDGIDYYKIQLLKPGRINVTSKSYQYGMNVMLLSDDEVTDIDSDNLWYGTLEEPKSLTQTADLEAGTYYIKIKSLDSYTGTYDINVSYLAMNNQDVEPNQVKDDAQPFTLNSSTKTGFLSWSDNLDLYKITLSKPGSVTLSATSYLYGVRVELLDSNLDKAAIDSNVWYGTLTEPKRFVKTVDLEAGTYFIRLKNLDHYTGKYQLKLNYQAANNQDKKGNDTPKTAQDLRLNSSLTGYLTWNDNIDVYKIKLTKSGKINFYTTSATYGLNVQLLKSNGITSVLSENIWYGSTKSPKRWNRTVKLSAGTYYIKINQLDNYTGKYAVRVNLLDTTPPANPKVNKVKSSSTYISGKTEANATVTAYVGKTKIGTAKANKNGNYKIKISRKKAGTTLTIYAKDSSSNTSKPTKIKVTK